MIKMTYIFLPSQVSIHKNVRIKSVYFYITVKLGDFGQSSKIGLWTNYCLLKMFLRSIWLTIWYLLNGLKIFRIFNLFL